MAEYIDRQAAVDALARLCKRVCQYSEKQRQYMCGACPLGDAFTVIEDDLPTADVRFVEWIPVTERLPEEGESVLVYGDLYPNKHDGGVIAVSKRMDWNYWQGFGRERDITHWMPLPPAPKEESYGV